MFLHVSATWKSIFKSIGLKFCKELKRVLLLIWLMVGQVFVPENLLLLLSVVAVCREG